MDGKELTRFVSNFWTDDFEDKQVLHRLFDGYVESVKKYYTDVHRLGLSQSIELHPGAIVDRWEDFTFESGGYIYSIDDDIFSIPTLQTGIQQISRILTDGADYTVLNGTITFLTTLPDVEMWAPIIFRNDPAVYDNFGTLVNLSADDFPGQRSTESLRIIRAIYHSYMRGPSVYNMWVGANALARLPFADHAGRIVTIVGGDLEPKQITIAWGDLGGGFQGASQTRYIAGRRRTEGTAGLTDASGSWLFDASMADVQVSYWVSILTDGHRDDHRVSEVSLPAHNASVKTVSAVGSTDSTGYILTDTTNGDFSSVQVGDLVKISAPIDSIGYYRIDRIDDGNDQLHLDWPAGVNMSNVVYTIQRIPGIQLETATGGNLSSLSWLAIDSTKSWIPNMWVNNYLVDQAGGRWTIVSNTASTVVIGEPIDVVDENSLPMTGTFKIMAPYAVDAQRTYDLDLMLLPTVSAGGYVRRFQPLSDGVQITDWRSDARAERYTRPLLFITADTSDINTISVASTAEVAKGDVYQLTDLSNTDGISITVAQVNSTTEIQLSQDVPSGYTVANFARLTPVQRDVEGLTGFYKLSDFSATGETDVADGTLFSDPSATWVTDGILAGDTLRIVKSDGTVVTSTISSVLTETDLVAEDDLGTSLTAQYYHFVKPFNPASYFSATATIALTNESEASTDILLAYLDRIRPSYIKIDQTTVAQDLVELSVIQEILPILFGLVVVEPEISSSLTNGEDLTSDNFMTASSGVFAVDSYVLQEFTSEEDYGGGSLTASIGEDLTNVDFFTATPGEVIDTIFGVERSIYIEDTTPDLTDDAATTDFSSYIIAESGSGAISGDPTSKSGISKSAGQSPSTGEYDVLYVLTPA